MADAAIWHRTILFFLVVGLILSVYAAVETYDPALRSTCTISPYWSCAKVDSSNYTQVGPIPDWSIGVGGYLAMLAIDIPLMRSYDGRLLQGLLVLSALGIVMSVYFAYVELVLIDAFCPVCLSTYFANIGVFVPALVLLRKRSAPVDDGPEAEGRAPE